MFINSRFKLFFFVGDLIRNTKNPKPVVKKKINKIKSPLEASEAKECTLVKIPDLTKNVPKTLSEKHASLAGEYKACEKSLKKWQDELAFSQNTGRASE